MNHASLFSGIGGFDLAAEWMGWDNIFHCDNEAFCQKTFSYNFPYSHGYSDICSFNGNEWRGKIDVLTGGFPCQPFSHAGKRRGAEDDRYLSPQMLRVIQEVRPSWVIGENVAGITSMAQFDSEPPMDDEGCAIGNIGDSYHRTGPGILKTILESLESEGYEVQPFIIPACAVGAPHRRDRIWIIANNDSIVREKGSIHKGSGAKKDRTSFEEISNFQFVSGRDYTFTFRGKDKSFFCGNDDGIPHRLDRIKALGNAIVPQVAYEIFKAIEFVSSDSIDDHA